MVGEKGEERSTRGRRQGGEERRGKRGGKYKTVKSVLLNLAN